MLIFVAALFLFLAFIAFCYALDMEDFSGLLFGCIFTLASIFCFVGHYVNNKSPEIEPKVKIIKCYDIEESNKEACKIELPDGKTDIMIREIKAEEFIDLELEQRETLEMILGV